MHFLNPWYLLGLLLASIPIVIHLLIVRKNKTIEFSSLRFLKELQKTQIRRLKLKQILLLILRTLIIVFLIFAFARPVLRSDFPLLRNYANVSAVIIIDNSFSMDVSDEFGNRLRQAKNFALNLLGQLKDGDQIALVFTTDKNNNSGFSNQIGYVNDEIARASISVSTSSYENALRLAQKVLMESKNVSKEIFLVSDFQKTALKSFLDSTKLFDNRTSLNLVHIGAKSKISIHNVSIDSIIPTTRIFEVGKKVEFEVYLSNHTDRNFENLVLSLFLNGERSAQRLFNINAKGKQKVLIGGIIQSTGIMRCTLEIENDALEYDNKRYFGFVVPGLIKIGLVSLSENSYIYRFLKDLDGDKIQFVFFAPSQLLNADLSSLSTLIIEEPIFEQVALENLRRFLENGKGLLLFPPSSGNTSSLVNLFSSFGINLNFESKNFQSINQPTFTFVDKNHPLFANVFATSDEKSAILPDPPKIKTLVTITTGVSLIQTNAGQFLTEINLGGGKVIFCGSAPNLAWGNLPLTSLFPVILYRSIFYLSSTNEYNISTLCGEQLMVNFPKGISPTNIFKIEDPLFNLNQIQAAQLPSGNLLRLEGLNLVGVYGIKSGEDKPIGTISVNVDTRESNLILADKEQIINYFRNVVHDGVKINYIEDLKKINEESFREFAGTELWKLFLILAIISVFAEMYIARTTKKELAE